MNDNLVATPNGDTTEEQSYKRIDRVRSIISDADNKIKSKETLALTPKGTGLCFTCTAAHIFRSRHANDPTILCNAMSEYRGEASSSPEMPSDIAECNRYSKIGDMSTWEMARMATLIDIREPGGHYL